MIKEYLIAFKILWQDVLPKQHGLDANLKAIQ